MPANKKDGTTEGGEYVRVAGDFLEIRQKIGAGHTSSSGKSKVVVTTGGFKPVQGSPVLVNLTAIVK